MLRQVQDLGDKAIGLILSGRLHDDDYDRFLPLIDRAVTLGHRVRILMEFEEFAGWDRYALWEDPNISAAHADQVERLALVGDGDLDEWIAKLVAPFTSAEVRRFVPAERHLARSWIEG